jgi:hypothetical protein
VPLAPAPSEKALAEVITLPERLLGHGGGDAAAGSRLPVFALAAAHGYAAQPLPLDEAGRPREGGPVNPDAHTDKPPIADSLRVNNRRTA